MAKIQNDLAESARINAALQKELNDLRAELESVRRLGSQPDARKVSRPGSNPGATASTVASPGNSATAGSASAGGPTGRFDRGMGGIGDTMHGRGMGATGVVFRGGMGGIGSGTAPKNQARYIQGGQLIVVSSPEGDTVTAYSFETGKAKSVRLAKGKDAKLEVRPVVTQGGLVALYLKGPKVTRIAAFSPADGNWHAQDLREPTDQAVPTISNTLVAYVIGRRVYAFNWKAQGWGVLELPEGAAVTPSVDNDAITCDHNGHLYVFSVKGSGWEDIDTRAVGDDQDGESAGK